MSPKFSDMRFRHDELKIRWRAAVLLCVARFTTGEIGYALVGQKVNLLNLVQPVFLNNPSHDLIQFMFRSRKASPHTLQGGADAHHASVAQGHEPRLSIRSNPL